MEVEDIIRRVRNGEAFVIFCEPLAEHHHNLLYCPNREQCDKLENYCESRLGYEIHEVVSYGCCHFCDSEDWLVVVASNGTIMTLLATPEFGKELKARLEEFEKTGYNPMKELASILGAVDGDVINAARRLIKKFRLYQWAVQELSLLIGEDKKKNEILEELRRELREVDAERGAQNGASHNQG